MIVYWDTSAWLKVYVAENHHEKMISLFTSGETHVSSALAYAEVHAALASMRRDRRVDGPGEKRIVDQIEKDWNSMVPIFAEMSLIRRAANLAHRFALRGYDSIHLASAEETRVRFGEMIVIASYDTRLISASKKLGLGVI